MLSLLAAILVFGLIILFHEFGHFLLAKRGGICVVEFSLGMGPRLFSMVKGGTRYSLKLFPFGGSCMMLGEDEDLSDDDRDERAGKNIAGKAAYGEDEFKDTKAASHKEAEQTRSYAGVELAPGATGVTFNETSVWTRFLVIAAGPVFNFILAFVCAFFVISYVGYDPAEVYSVVEGYPAAEAGIEPVYSAENGSYMMGISGGVYKKPESVFVTAKYSAYELRYWINLTFKSLGMIVKRQVKTDDIAGPVRIVSMIDSTVRESSEYGLMVVLVNLANMCVLLSANLGIMNLLPIPALDGGRLVFIILEALRGRPIDREKEGMIHMAGMAVLMVLMVFILFNDIRNML